MAKEKMTLEEAIVKDGPYEVPGKWVWSKIKFIGNIKGGKRLPKGKQLLDFKTDFPYIRVADFDSGTIDIEGLKYLDEESFNQIKNYTISAKDVYVSIAGSIGKVGIIPEILEGANLTENAAKITGITGISNKYLYYLLSSEKFQRDMQEASIATTQAKLALHKIGDLIIPIPPLKEQQRIVDRIESLFGKLDKAKELIEAAREGFEKRKAAVLEKAFRGELTEKWREKNNKLFSPNELFNNIKHKRLLLTGTNREKKEIELLFNAFNLEDNILETGWIKLKAAMICEQITCGKTPTGNIVSHGEVRYLKVYNIVNNKIDFEYKPQFIDYETHSMKLKSSMLKPNDVVMNIVGPPLRKIAIIPDTYDKWNMNQAIVRFRTIECVDYKYFYYSLIYDETLRDVINDTRGVVGQANISVSQSRNLDILVPSFEEQREIVRILDKILQEEEKIEELTQLEDQIELIKKSILAKAFRGELGTNSEEDESALELLKEILYKK